MRILSDARVEFVRAQYAAAPAPVPLFGYNTVADYCESFDALPELATSQGDLKDVQRPWAIRTIVSHVRPGATVIEIGAGEPLVAQALVDLGYRVIVVDPYDGSGLGPTAYDDFVRSHPDIAFVRADFAPGAVDLRGGRADAIYSVSVLEHVREAGLLSVFAGVEELLAPGGLSLHCYDFIVKGVGASYNQGLVDTIASAQSQLHGLNAVRAGAMYQRALDGIRNDLETYYLSAAGHNLWRGQRPYDEFPYRRVASFTTVARRRA